MNQSFFQKVLHRLATLLPCMPTARSWSLAVVPLVTLATLSGVIPFNAAALGRQAASEPISLFLLEITLAIDFGILSLATLVLRLRRSWRRRVLVGVCWLVWAGALFSLPYMLTNSLYGRSVMALFAILLPVFVFPLGMEGLFQVIKLAPQTMPRAIIALFANALLFFLPFFLWAPNGMERFWTATFFALLLGGLALYAEFISFGRETQAKPPAKKR